MNKDNKVIVTHGNGPFENIKEALSSLDLKFLKGKSVLIKPNIGRSTSKSKKGINTHPQAIAGVIEVLQEVKVKKIAIGESPIVGVKTLEAFEKAGVTDIAKKYNCELIDLDKEKPVIKSIPKSRVVSSTKICSRIFEFDYILSLPVAKMHMHTGVTLGIKNMKGCLYKREKVRYHQLEYRKKDKFEEMTLDSAISDLATILLPDITVIDGYIGMEGLGPSGGEPIKSDFAVASLNSLGADTIGCIMMGLDPREIPHLRLISERLDLSIEPDNYDVVPDNYKNYLTKYKKPPQEISIEYPDVVLCDKESCSACLSTVMFFLKRFKTDMSQYLSDDNKLRLAIGKGLTEKDINDGTILIGNCTSNFSKKGIFIPGCPPVPTRIYKAITGKEPDENEPEIN
jgi:uncharacterized protein (DUF362 family)